MKDMSSEFKHIQEDTPSTVNQINALLKLYGILNYEIPLDEPEDQALMLLTALQQEDIERVFLDDENGINVECRGYS